MAKKIVIDPGHGGNDPGTSANGIVEKDINLQISKYMYDRLRKLGIDTSITRDNDISLSPSERVKKIQNYYGNGKDVIVVSNHVNSGGGDGAEIIYALRNNDTLSKKIAKEFENAGQNVRKYYQRRLPSNTSKDYYFLLRDTPDNESIIVEYGFVDSSGDDVSILKNNWKELAESVVKALAEYAGVKYTNETNSDKLYYKVVSGDSLWSIAKKYGTSVDTLKQINNLTSNLLSIGQIIYLPDKNAVDNDSEKYYIIQPGDTLYSIARKYNLSVSKLKDLNNLNSDFISVGQKLLITGDNNIYIVKKGDTLYSIAQKYGTSVSKLASINNLSTSILQIGQKLIIK